MEGFILGVLGRPVDALSVVVEQGVEQGEGILLMLPEVRKGLDLCPPKRALTQTSADSRVGDKLPDKGEQSVARQRAFPCALFRHGVDTSSAMRDTVHARKTELVFT